MVVAVEVKPEALATFLKFPVVEFHAVFVVTKVPVVPNAMPVAPVRTVQPVGKPDEIELKSCVYGEVVSAT